MKNLLNELVHQNDYIGLDIEGKVTLIKELVKKLGITSIIEEITEVLQSEKEEEMYVVSLLLRDVCTRKGKRVDFDEVVAQFRSAVENSSIFEIMNQNLYSSDRLIRETTYRTFGLTCFTQNTQYLKEAEVYYKKYFPDQLEDLEFEHKWLINLGKDESRV